MLKLKLQYFGHVMQIGCTMEKTLILGKIKGKRREQQRIRWIDSITDSMDKNLGKLRERVEDRGAWHTAVHEVTKNWTGLSNQTATDNDNQMYKYVYICMNLFNEILKSSCSD